MLILPGLLAACGGLSACTTQQAARPTTSFAAAPTVAPMLPETAPVPALMTQGSAEDGARSLAHEVEMNAGVKPVAFAAPTPVATLTTTEKRVESFPAVPPPVTAAQLASLERKSVGELKFANDSKSVGETRLASAAKPAGEPYEEEPPSVMKAVAEAPVVKAVVDTPVEAAKVTLASLGGAIEALPQRFGRSGDDVAHTRPAPEGRLGPGGEVAARSEELDQLIKVYADYYQVPEELVRRVAKRESTFNPRARNGIYMGLMQISPATARGMGYRGAPAGLLDAETNLKYSVRYLRGAYVVARGNHNKADRLYQTGYYYHAKRAGLLDETGVGIDRKRRNRL